MDRGSWFVSSSGSGATDVERTMVGVDPAVVLAGEIGRVFYIGPSLVQLEVEGGLPVHANRVGQGSDVRGEGAAGYAAVRASWAW
jgi:hypothetical protein